MKADKERQFPDEKVEVKVPRQKTNSKVKVKKLTPGKIGDHPVVPGKFSPRRYVIRIDFEDEVDPRKKFKKFDPALELRVRYTQADVDRAKAAGGELRLGYSLGVGKPWEYFTAKKHNFRLVPDKDDQTEGVGVVEIRDWDDPAISWGS